MGKCDYLRPGDPIDLACYREQSLKKPLACYPGDHPDGVTEIASTVCDSSIVLDDYAATNTTFQARYPKGQPDCSTKVDQQTRSRCFTAQDRFRDSAHALPVIAGNSGGLDYKNLDNPLRLLVPFLDAQGINDIRSTETLLTILKNDSALRHTLAVSKKLSVLYPGSGSHVAPLAMGLAAAKQGLVRSAQFTYTELDPDALHRLTRYLTQMEQVGMIKDLKLSQETLTLGAQPNAEVRLAWDAHGVPMQLTFLLNCTGKYWVPDALIPQHNVIMLHDSMYQHGANPDPIFIKMAKEEGTDPRQSSHLVSHLRAMTAHDQQPRVVITEDQWHVPEVGNAIENDYPCSTSGRCTIGGHMYSLQHYAGFYGHGLSAMGPQKMSGVDYSFEYYLTADKLLRQRPVYKGEMQTELHLGDMRDGALVISILPSPTRD